ncbi:hypothetical protein QJS66_21560 [Kocuria rhizophila]|nr:hypothetical protein QJS66_21560 [Kocuria rhizophila]
MIRVTSGRRWWHRPEEWALAIRRLRHRRGSWWSSSTGSGRREQTPGTRWDAGPAQIFSVTIPPCSVREQLHELVELCAVHPTVLEVIVVNNHPAPAGLRARERAGAAAGAEHFRESGLEPGGGEARRQYLAIIMMTSCRPRGPDIAAESRRAAPGILALEGLFLNRATRRRAPGCGWPGAT